MVVIFFMNRETVISQPTQSSATDQRQLHESFPSTSRVLLGTDERIDLAQSLTEIAISLNGFRYDRED